MNGIDTGLWDPELDSVLPAPYNSKNLEGKALCKRFFSASKASMLPSHQRLLKILDLSSVLQKGWFTIGLSYPLMNHSGPA